MVDAVREVVVGDDEVEREGFGFGRGGEGADAGVDRDDESDSVCGGLGDAGGLHAVTLAEAMGDVVGDLGGAGGVGDALDGGLEQDGGGGAVDVVVAVDEDGLTGLDGAFDAGDGFGHAEQEVGIVEMVEGGCEEFLGLGDVAGGEESGDGCGVGVEAGEGLGVNGDELPGGSSWW